MEWYNEPASWTGTTQRMSITTAAKTDFWRETHYGFIRDSGHFYHCNVAGDFTIAVQVHGRYESLYDQAGLMVRVDEANWMKCGIEFVDGVQQASVVVTRDFSDWSVVALPQNPPSVWLKVVRRKEALEVRYSLTGQNYVMLRMAYLKPAEEVSAGIMCASPEGEGFAVTFEGLAIESI
jgi:regulation of enolase protein 1 (concanavalin A-like superfamily)